MEPLQPAADESRVLVIYTGGTIGMLVGKQGYVPEPYFLTETLRSQNRFHDPQRDSLFSHSGSVQGYRNWSSGGGRNSPQPTGVSNAATAAVHRTLLVRSSKPIGTPDLLSLDQEQTIRRQTCVKVAEDVYEAHLPSLVTPYSAVPGGTGKKAIRYVILEWNPLLDSSNVEMSDWKRIATEIELNYSFDAFVILHGTDTMAYTSSALSFMLEDLGKTVIVTGAQIPMSQLRNDAVDNFMGALTIAGHYIIPECCVYFNHTLYRGNRVSKMSSYDLSAFSSPNFAPLVNVGIEIVVNWNDVLRQTGIRRFRAHKEMSPHVATLRLFPGIAAATVRAFFMPPIRGVVLETFGAGNAPQRVDLMQALTEACDRGVVVVAITQCSKGSVSDAYETGRTLLQAGVVSGGDMTPECALTKLSYLLSKPELSAAQVRDLIATPLRGELTAPARAVPSNTDKNFDKIHNVLSEFVRLVPAVPQSPAPQITVSSPSDNPEKRSKDSAAPWTWTAAEVANTEATLLPFLIHLAAARNNVAGIKFCIDFNNAIGAAEEANEDVTRSATSSIAGGVVNCLDPATGQTPLHVASLNGGAQAVDLLLRSGALVHLRDILGHTALYYAARQGHEEVVDELVQAGATLAGIDEPFSLLGAQQASLTGNAAAMRTWAKARSNTQTTQLQTSA